MPSVMYSHTMHLMINTQPAGRWLASSGMPMVNFNQGSVTTWH